MPKRSSHVERATLVLQEYDVIRALWEYGVGVEGLDPDDFTIEVAAHVVDEDDNPQGKICFELTNRSIL